MLTRIWRNNNSGFPMWTWFLILPGIVLVTALLVRRRRKRAQMPQAVIRAAQEFRLEESTRGLQPQAAEATQPAMQVIVSDEITESSRYQEGSSAIETSAEITVNPASPALGEPENAEAVSPPAAPREDLKVLEGIGPKIEAILNDGGLTTYQQIAESTVEDLYGVLRQANLRLADPTSWPEQARLAAEGNWDLLKALQNGLRAGRRSNKR